MFDISFNQDGDILMSGRLDAAQAPSAQNFLDGLDQGCVINLAGLEYISSAGLGVLLRTHKRLMACENGLVLTHVNSHIRAILGYSGFDRLFEIRDD